MNPYDDVWLARRRGQDNTVARVLVSLNTNPNAHASSHSNPHRNANAHLTATTLSSVPFRSVQLRMLFAYVNNSHPYGKLFVLRNHPSIFMSVIDGTLHPNNNHRPTDQPTSQCEIRTQRVSKTPNVARK